MQAGGVEQN
jgi:hypothetical protein